MLQVVSTYGYVEMKLNNWNKWMSTHIDKCVQPKKLCFASYFNIPNRFVEVLSMWFPIGLNLLILVDSFESVLAKLIEL